MIHRQPAGAQRPPPPQRSHSGTNLQAQQGLNRPNHPSKLSAVRTASQPHGNVVDLTHDGASGPAKPVAAFRDHQRPPAGSARKVVDLDGDDGAPPAKKAKYIDHRPIAAEDGKTVEETKGLAYKQMQGSPLPTPSRPHLSARSSMRRRRPQLDATKRAARRADGVNAPQLATRLPPPKDVADFSPWTGQHPEDTLNEHVIKTGYFDKGPAGGTQAESNTARATLWPNISHKNSPGLQMLSHMFVQVLDKRQLLGRCTAPSTFKPPPRVTVTDTKREAWLKDLANSEVPLRKMSRTIPHGIRGKLLLEQCLNKHVPLQRAVWLAKCVGANELRAFRRKGVSGAAAASGEQKWIREWTVAVEQFVEGVVAACGQEEWQAKMTYATKLVVHIYAEKLLDSEHYLDWFADSFRDASLERLPIWIVLVQIYWNELVAFGRRGRRVADATLAHLLQLSERGSAADLGLTVRLQKLVTVLAVTKRGCLVLPKVWDRYKHLLMPKNQPEDSDASRDSIARNIMKRNERLVSPTRRSPANTRSALLNLYNLLDSVTLTIDVAELSQECQSILPDKGRLVAALLKWASSLYREGTARIYLAAKLTEHLHDSGFDTDAAILTYLADLPRVAALDVNLAYKVISELVRAGRFSVGRYLQWLISMGASSGAGKCRCDTGLIVALPLQGLPDSLLNLRKTLMRRLSYHVEQDELSRTTTIRFVESITSAELQQDDDIAQMFPSGLCASSKYLAIHEIWMAIRSDYKDSTPSLKNFCTIRDVLENLEDAPILAELLEFATASNEPAVLSSTADTTNMHAEVLAAVGTLPTILEHLLERHRVLRGQQPLDRALLLALIGLTKLFPDRVATIGLLQNDLMLCEQQNSTMVCSPASDNMVCMQPTALDSDDDIDQIFASGNVMDEQLMGRVFAKVMDRAAKPNGPVTTEESISRVCSWLVQLDTVDAAHFQLLVRKYLEHSLAEGLLSDGFLNAVGALVACDTLEIHDFMEALSGPASMAPEAVASVLPLLTQPASYCMGLSVMEKYRLELYCKNYNLKNTAEVVRLACVASESRKVALDPVPLLPLLRSYMLHDSETGGLGRPYKPSSKMLLGSMRPLVFPSAQAAARDGKADPLWNPADIVAVADELSLPFCQYALRQVINSLRDGEAIQDDEPVVSALRNAIRTGCTVWPQLVEVLDKRRIRALHNWAVEQVLLRDLKQAGEAMAGVEDSTELYLEIVDITAQSIGRSEQSAPTTATTERLQALEKRLCNAESSSHEEWQALVTEASTSVHTLLHLALLQHQGTPSESNDDAALRGRKDLLAVLGALLVHPRLQQHHQMLEYLFDAIATLADDLPSDALASLARNFPADPRLAFLFGPPSTTSCTSTDTACGLALATRLPRAPQPPRPQCPGAPQRSWSGQQPGRPGAEAALKMTPFPLRRWEIIPDPTVNTGENDVSISLGLFGGRKVQ